ncbi:hypothetical protein BJV82DRAFT_618251 [Fennellomyces sp. T-0311]|nr:hypothetical protein BJV82DRAFT_618251 [Fennellomyces sp. T-0311]
MNGQEQTALTNLPSEIIHYIATNYLDASDLGECMCTSSTWYTIFSPFRYHNVKLFDRVKSRSFLQKLGQSMSSRKLRSTSLDTINRFSHIKKLDIQDGVMTAKEMERLGTLCSNTTSVRFYWQVSADQQPVKSHTATTRRFYSPAGFLEHFRPSNVTCLELTGSGNGCDIPSDVFRHLPQLLSLTISSTRYFISIAYLEKLHDLCPGLRYIKFTVPNVFDDSVSAADIERVVPARSMRNLCFHRKQLWEARNVLDGTWFRYIVRKYPELRCLDIGTKHRIFERALQASRSEEDVSNAAIVALRDYFPRLDDLSLGEFAGKPSITWPLLVRGISKITLCDDTMSLFPAWISNDATKGIEKLSLSAVPNDLRGLGNCKYLRELNLDSGPFLQPDKPCGTPEIALDVILSCCSVLRKLTVSGSFIRYDDTPADKSPLEYLELVNAALTNEALAHIAHHCPSIIHLNLRMCIWVDSSEYPVIRLDFSQHRLSYFRLVSPWTCREVERDRMYASFFPDEFGRTRYITHRKPGVHECFMLKKDKSNRMLFDTRPLATDRRAKVTRLHHSDIMEWLDGSQDQVKQAKAKQAIESLRGLKGDHVSFRYWSTVLSCRSVTLLYYNDGRLNVDDDDFCSTGKKY